jgi:phytol kinase
MNASWLLLPPVLASLALAMAALSALQRAGRLSPEGARKLFHVAMGAITLAFPWVFSGPAPVIVLAGAACAWLEGVRRIAPLQRVFGSVLSAVARPGRGEIHYVAGTAASFAIANGSALGFCVPMAILALADAAAAVVGRRYGTRPGAIVFRTKSLAGSSAFFAVALAVSLVGLEFAGWPDAAAVAVALLLAGLTTLLEALAGDGADNLLVPVCAALVLRALTDPPTAECVARFLGMGALATAAMAMLGARCSREALP